MKTTLIAVLTVALTVGLLQALGNGSAFEKYLRYISALLLTLTLLSPLSQLINGDFSFEDLFIKQENTVAETVPEAYLRRFETEIENAVSSLLKEEFSLEFDQARPVASAEDAGGTPVLACLELRLYTLKGAAFTGKIRKRLEQALGCKVSIVEDVRW